MGYHVFDPSNADRLEDPERFRFCSREELLQHLPREPDSYVLDVGSGSGFYTDELAPFLGHVVGLDLHHTMHTRHQDRGVADNVSLVTGDAASLPFPDERFDAAVSTMTFHESATERSLVELHRTMCANAPVVIVDWSANGSGEAGPPTDERYDVIDACRMLVTAGFTIRIAAERTETFLVVATS